PPEGSRLLLAQCREVGLRVAAEPPLLVGHGLTVPRQVDPRRSAHRSIVDRTREPYLQRPSQPPAHSVLSPHASVLGLGLLPLLARFRWLHWTLRKRRQGIVNPVQPKQDGMHLVRKALEFRERNGPRRLHNRAPRLPSGLRHVCPGRDIRLLE